MYNDRELLAKTLMAEAGNQGPLGMLAAGSVIMNRVRSGNYGQGLQGVILKPGAFSPWNSVTGFAGGEQGQDMARITPSEQAYRIADTLLSGKYEDPTNNATHFYNPDISDPSWGIRGGNEWRRIGAHVFGRADDRTKGPSRVVNVGSDAPKFVASDTMAALGKGGGAVTPDQIAQSAQAQSTGMQEDQRPRGLLGGLFGNPDMMANLALAFNSMRLNPDPNLGAVLSAQMKERRDERKAAAQKNRTLDYLRSLGTPQAMQAIRYAEGTGDIAGALKMATAASKAEGTAAMQNYAEYNRILKELGPEAANKFLEMTSGQKTVVSIQDKGETKMAETFGKGIAEQALQALEVGGQAQRNLGRYQLLGEILANAPQGGKGAFIAAASNFGIKFDGASDAEAAEAIINQLVPEQRKPGSGPMSDADLALFKRSLPRLVNSPEGNRLILETLNAISQYDIQRAMIAQELASGSIDVPEYLKKLNSLPNPLEMFRQAGGAAAPTMSREEAMRILEGE